MRAHVNEITPVTSSARTKVPVSAVSVPATPSTLASTANVTPAIVINWAARRNAEGKTEEYAIVTNVSVKRDFPEHTVNASLKATV